MFAAISRSDVPPQTRENESRVRVRPSGVPHAAALQRSAGCVDLVFAVKSGTTRAKRAFQQGAMKARFPTVATGDPPEAVLLNTAGGLTGGDSQIIAIDVEPGADVVVTTQACERIYRSLGDNAVISGRLRLASGTKLEWLPQPLIVFNGARLKRETHVELSSDASLLAVESVIFGRTASGEAVAYGALSDAWFVRRAGRLIHAERFAAGGNVGTLLDKPSVLAGHRAMATIRYLAPDANARLEEMRNILCSSAVPVAASAWNGILLVRLVSADGYSLNRELMRVLEAFRGRPLPRVWSL